MTLRVFFYFVILCITCGCAPVRKDTLNKDEEANCFFEKPRSSNIETEKRHERFTVRNCLDKKLKKMTDINLIGVKNLFGANDALSLVLCRGAAMCDIDTSRPETLSTFEKEHICESHTKELLTQWDSFSYSHVLKKKTKEGQQTICSFPNELQNKHDDKKVVKKSAYNSISIQEAYTLLKTRGFLIPPGTPICDMHREYVDSLSIPEEKYCDYDQPTCSEPITPNTPATCGNDVKSLFRKFAASAGFTRICSRKRFSDLSYDSQLRKVSLANGLYDEMLQQIAPLDTVKLRLMAQKKGDKEIWLRDREDNLSYLLKNIAYQYRLGENRAERISILSTVARVLPLNQIQLYIPGLSRRLYDEARRMKKFNTKTEKRKRERYNPSAVNLFIQFITSNMVMSPYTFGSKKITYSDGKVDVVPQTIRKQSATEIIRMFKSFLKDTDQEQIQLSDSTYYDILKRCSATTLKSYQCVDYFRADAFEAQKDIVAVLDFLRSKSYVTTEFVDDISKKVDEYVHYLKTDFSLHVKKNSKIADHCINWALSDPKEHRLATDCNHNHDLECPRCQSGRDVMIIIKNTMDTLIFKSKLSYEEGESTTTQDIDDLLDNSRKIKESIEKIEELKKHMVRSRETDNEKTLRLQNLKNGDAVVLMDYAQKLLPMKHRETQKDYFGKVGMSWHISHITANVSNQLVTHNYIHIIREKQIADVIVAICDHVISDLKKIGIQQFYLRSDNAGTYHSSTTIGSMTSLSQKHDVKIMEYTFSEAQNGKSDCDRVASIAKRKIHVLVDSGFDITNEDQFYEALSSKSPMVATTVSLVRLEAPSLQPKQNSGKKQKTNNKKQKIDMISQLYHFTYTDNEVIGNGYNEIGTGIVMNKDNVLSVATSLNIEKISGEANVNDVDSNSFWFSPKSKSTKKDESSSDSKEEEEGEHEADIAEPRSNTKIYPCPTPGCIKSFSHFGFVTRHIIYGEHIFHPERTTLIDHALNLYKNNIEHTAENELLVNEKILKELEPTIDDESAISPRGWALRSRRKSGRFSKPVIDELTRLFDEGNTRGMKYTPEEVQKVMREKRNLNNEHTFKEEDLLNSRQISSFFSRLKAQREQKRQKRSTGSGTSNEEDEDMFSHDYELLFKYEPFYPELDSLLREVVNSNLNYVFDMTVSSEPDTKKPK